MNCQFIRATALIVTGLFSGVSLLHAAEPSRRPNIVYVICDDLGYGDVNCLAPETCRIRTPHADRLAKRGITFTDAHSGSSVCTPTRYGLLTGRYSWRTKLQKGVVTGYAPCLIDSDRPTVQGFLQQLGYHTAIIGKWHLNFQYTDQQTGQLLKQSDHKNPPVGAEIPDGPLARGFHFFHGFHHARDMESVIENDRVIAHDETVNMLPRLTKQSVRYIESRAGSEQPFFLYVPLGSPHTPIVPSAEWQGRSGLGDYGDFVMQTDHALGEILDALDRTQKTKNTLIVFTSDNGCSKAADIPALARQGHLVSAHLRGSKADLWDGGHRVPMIVSWPGVTAAATTSHQTICHTDLFATVSEVTATPMPENAAQDSVSFLPALYGKSIPAQRHGIIHHSFSGHFAYRQGPWKLLLARGSGGWTSPKENQVSSDTPQAQLYNLNDDPGETINLYREKPEIVRELLDHLKEDIARGRSTSGSASANDVQLEKIVLWKSGEQPRSRKNPAKK